MFPPGLFLFVSNFVEDLPNPRQIPFLAPADLAASCHDFFKETEQLAGNNLTLAFGNRLAMPGELHCDIHGRQAIQVFQCTFNPLIDECRTVAP